MYKLVSVYKQSFIFKGSVPGKEKEDPYRITLLSVLQDPFSPERVKIWSRDIYQIFKSMKRVSSEKIKLLT